MTRLYLDVEQIEAFVKNSEGKNVRHLPTIVTSILFFGALCSRALTAETITIEVSAGEYDRRNVPVSCELPEQFRGAKNFTLIRLDTDQPIPVQIDPQGTPRLIWLMREKLAAGGSRRYRLALGTPRISHANSVSVKNDGKILRLSVGTKDVLHYRQATVSAPRSQAAYYRRSGYIHPLFNPAGQMLTDDFAPDHPHQHGMMFPWTNTTFERRAINFWDQAQQKTRVEHVATEQTVSGPVFGELQVKLQHVDLTAPTGEKPVLNELWQVRVYALAESFLIDFRSVQSCAGQSPLTIKKYHYGGMAIRGNRAWLQPDNGDFLTSDGKTRKDGNHTRPHWVEMQGKIDGRTTGMTLFCHPENFRSPQPVRLHPAKPYFCFAPMVLGEFRIEPGKPYVSRYRLSAHNGPITGDAAEQLWNDYAHPLLARSVASP